MSQNSPALTGLRPILFTWRGTRIYSYQALMYLGIVLGVAASNVAANSIGLNSARVYLATLVLIPVGLIGARLLFVALQWETYRGNLSRIWSRSEGGSAEFGGILLVIVVSGPLLAVLQVPYGSFWDVASFTFLIGAMFTRVGCLLNGCCGGRATRSSLALSLPDEHGIWERRFPAQLLASAWAGVLLIVAIVLMSRRPFPGGIFLLTLGLYSLGRMALETVRIPAQDPVPRIQVLHRSAHLLLAVVPIILFLSLWQS
jgi:prolipoprotein diacylglyceryltransferase